MFQFDNVEGDGAAHFDDPILPAVLQHRLVFGPGQLERWRPGHLTVEAGLLPSHPLQEAGTLQKRWGLWKVLRLVLESTLTRCSRVRVELHVHAAVGGHQLTLDRENAAAAGTAGIIVHLTGVDPRILKLCRVQLEAGGQLHEGYPHVVSIVDLLIIFVPADIQGLRAAHPAFQAVAFTQLYEGSGRKFLDKLRRFCRVK